MKILIADDHPIFRAGLSSMLTDILPGTAISECSDGLALKAMLAREVFDLLILDVFFPALRPDADIKDFRRAYPTLAILVVSMLTERTAIERLLRSGANGFVSKSGAPELMSKGVLEVLEGERPIYLPSLGRGRRQSASTPDGSPASDLSGAVEQGDRQRSGPFSLYRTGTHIRNVSEAGCFQPCGGCQHWRVSRPVEFLTRRGRSGLISVELVVPVCEEA